MSPDLERDLDAWASGSLSRERLLVRHGVDAAGTVALHERLMGLAAGMPVPDADAGWVALVSKIEGPAPVVPIRRHGRRRRTVSLLVAAVLVAAGAAFASVGGPAHDRPPIATVGPSVLPSPASGAYRPDDRWFVPRQNPVGAVDPHGPTSPAEDGGSNRPSGGAPGGSGDRSSSEDPVEPDHATPHDGTHGDTGSGNDGSTDASPPGGQDQGGQGQDEGSGQGN